MPKRIPRSVANWLHINIEWVYLGLILFAVIAQAITLALFFHLSEENEQRVSDIQRERAGNIRRTCEADRFRHDETIRRYDLGIQDRLEALGREPTREELAQMRRSREFLVFLIDAIVPKENCDDLVARGVDSKEGGR
jgi:hypothetical protein